MRWFWIDRFVEFESGRSATAIKNISLAEDHLHDHFPGAPIMPNSLIIEGIAQTAGLLVAQHGDFVERVVLAKVSKVKFHTQAVPGDTLTYRVSIQDITKQGAAATGTAHIGEKLQAEVELFFAHLGDRTGDQQLFDPVTFLSILNMVGVFKVGRNADGTPIQPPAHLVQAAAAAAGR